MEDIGRQVREDLFCQAGVFCREMKRSEGRWKLGEVRVLEFELLTAVVAFFDFVGEPEASQSTRQVVQGIQLRGKVMTDRETEVCERGRESFDPIVVKVSWRQRVERVEPVA